MSIGHSLVSSIVQISWFWALYHNPVKCHYWGKIGEEYIRLSIMLSTSMESLIFQNKNVVFNVNVVER